MMTRQNIAIGTAANDGTGDTLRSAGSKINENFVEIYQRIGGDSDVLASQISFEDSAIVFEGALTDAHETRLTAVNPTADRQVQIPNATGIIVVDTATQTLTNKTLTSPSLSTPKVTTAINDTNSNELIKFTATSSAVNEVTIINAATSNNPQVNASGGDTNVNLNLNSKGTGSVEVSKLALEAVEISADGNASQSATYIICNKGTALAVGLPDGTTTGEYKIFTNKGAGTATITPTSFGTNTSFAIAQNEGAQCIWDGSNWFLVGNQSVTTVA
jgi:hypothetical protein